MLKAKNLKEYRKAYEKTPGNCSRYYTKPEIMHRYYAYIKLIPDGSKVLDVGCNAGGLGNNLRNQKNCLDYGIDITDLWKKYVPKEFHYRYKVGMAENLSSIIKDTFDVVTCCEFLEHLLDVDVVMKEIMKVLKKDGILVGSVPHNKGKRGYGHYKLDTDVHMREFNKESLRELLEKYFKKIVITESIRLTNNPTLEFYIFKASNKKI